ncbi:ribosomal protein L11 methyltransferase [Streptococcus pneumoniae]|nr:ribosomal protein L11 methyltransferase [Streptococcus pneumoniae]
METWQELKVTVKREGEELVSNLLIELGAQGVAIEDSLDYVGNVDRFGEIFPEVEQQEEIVVTAYYPETVDVAAVEADLQARLAELTDFMDLGEVKMGTTALAEEDWADNWKKYYKPARITHDLTIVPSWTDYEATAGEKIIKLDPGMAFGTGTHPTTKMSLFALEQVLRGGETVLDVGTGSGVLSIASSLLGAKEIFAYDLDDVAVRVAQENIELNTGLETGAKLLFIFGPEGGLSPVEIESFEAKGAVLVGLGPRILRAETAPLYALSALSVLVELEK